MFKFGVHSIEQLERNKTLTVFGAAKKVSVTLLDEARNSQQSEEAYASIMFDLNDDRGTYKRTYGSRFDDFDNVCIEAISEAIPGPELSIHDVAVSSAETATDFFGRLVRRYPSVRYLATDYDPFLTILVEGPLCVSITSQNLIVEVLLPPFVLTPIKPDRRLYVLNRALLYLLQKTWVRSLVKRYDQASLPKTKVRQLDLFSPKAKLLADSDRRFSLGQHDILDPDDRVFDCIRAMNVLNESYFSRNEFSTVVQNLYKSIREGGLLIVGSNDDSGTPVSGAIYTRRAGKFEIAVSTGELPFADKHIRSPVN